MWAIRFIFRRFNVSTMLRILQYIFWAFSFRNPPAIFGRFFTFLRSLSDILLSKGTSKRFKNRRWFSRYFSKRVNRATDPGDGIPSHKELTSQLDYEAELAVILKKDAKDVALEDVEDYIFGYTIMNDVSAREVQTAHRQWYFGKSLDGFTPLGPWIVTADSVEFPPKLRIQSRVNGELRQDSNTEQFIHGIAEVVSELSRGMTLKAGTIIATGTPAGVGMGFDPPRFLKPGDVVECVIEGIGTLKNPVVE